MTVCGAARVVNHLSFSYFSGSSVETLDIFWDKNTGLMVRYDLSQTGLSQTFTANITLTSTSVWSKFVPNPPVSLIPTGSANATTPSSYFKQYGIGITTKGAANVTVISSANPAAGVATPPSNMSALTYLDVSGTRLPGSSQIILYVYYNVTLCTKLGLNQSSLVICLWNTTSPAHWQVLPTTHLVLNSTCGVIFAAVPHFSYFAVFGAVAVHGGTGISAIIVIAVAAAVVVVLVVLVAVKKLKKPVLL
jgi:hypothetical protein